MTTNDLQQAFADTLARHAAHAPGRTVAVAFEHLPTRATVAINAHETFHPASTIKVPLLVALHRRAHLGQLDLAQQLRIHNGFPSSIDGSLFDVHAEDDSETTLYTRMGESETLAELARLMIVRSSNLATNLLLEVVSPAEVTADMHDLGLNGLLLRNRMMDLKAFHAKFTNRGNAADLCQLMSLLGRRQLPGSQVMLDILLAQQLNEGLPAGLPPDARCAHKTGAITAHFHDIALVNDTWAIAVLTRGYADESLARALTADLAADAAASVART